LSEQTDLSALADALIAWWERDLSEQEREQLRRDFKHTAATDERFLRTARLLVELRDANKTLRTENAELKLALALCIRERDEGRAR
jgi:hypothetical protein